MKKKSSLFLGIFILLITIATILFFKINQPSEDVSLSYESRQFFTKREKIEDVISKFIKGELERFSNGKASCNAQ